MPKSTVDVFDFDPDQVAEERGYKLCIATTYTDRRSFTRRVVKPVGKGPDFGRRPLFVPHYL